MKITFILFNRYSYNFLQESREGRVASWKTFQSNASKSKSSDEGGPAAAPFAQGAPAPCTSTSAKKPKKMKTFRPPKHKAETR